MVSAAPAAPAPPRPARPARVTLGEWVLNLLDSHHGQLLAAGDVTHAAARAGLTATEPDLARALADLVDDVAGRVRSWCTLGGTRYFTAEPKLVTFAFDAPLGSDAPAPAAPPVPHVDLRADLHETITTLLSRIRDADNADEVACLTDSAGRLLLAARGAGGRA